MSYLLDTNVLSELRRKKPNAGVVAWFSKRPATALYLSVLTLGEMRKGVEAAIDIERRAALSDWLDVELPAFFAGRILPIDARVADRWGHLMAEVKRPIPAVDSLLAATAMHHGLTMVTRNEKDFSDLGVPVINPWVK